MVTGALRHVRSVKKAALMNYVNVRAVESSSVHIVVIVCAVSLALLVRGSAADAALMENVPKDVHSYVKAAENHANGDVTITSVTIYVERSVIAPHVMLHALRSSLAVIRVLDCVEKTVPQSVLYAMLKSSLPY